MLPVRSKYAAQGTSTDCDSDGTPDECQPQDDCQPNGSLDFCDIALGTSQDCNRNAIPDECDRPGDIDADLDTDFADFATFALCYAGAAVTIPPPGCTDDQFCSSDIDDDGDVDLADFATFALYFMS